ncbi:HAD family hydrolase [Egibacter rhizosphaerae]|uniref:HAD family hydrolase n=1 Tax=Egibacter rhizosphaerae TaxID=1670831 RepID=A0A411YCJ4_9ACTN|nr:HAD family hydrolase [Egibacter rhizosphaerae]QBI18920.1 HAD family hydrolase [Egibacter rhizosphaerae]
MTKAAAFFDLDRTLMSGSSAYYFGKAAYREGLLPLPRLLADGVSGLVFRLFGASDEKSEKLRDRILASVAGHEAESFRRLCPQVVEEILPRIRPEAQALLDMHAEADRDVWIVSASPVEIVEELASALELTGGLGTQSEIVDGVYTGNLAAPFCYGEGKAEVMRKLMAERGYEPTSCYAYSDSASDLPMMQLVGNPVAVNPDRPMMAVAHRRGWPVIEFNRQQKRVMRWSLSTGLGAVAGVGGYGLGRWHGRRRAAALLAQPRRMRKR